MIYHAHHDFGFSETICIVIVSNLGRFGPGSFRPESSRPGSANLGVGRFGLGRWVVSANFLGESNRPPSRFDPSVQKLIR